MIQFLACVILVVDVAKLYLTAIILLLIFQRFIQKSNIVLALKNILMTSNIGQLMTKIIIYANGYFKF